MKTYQYVLQENNFDCGVASLLTCFYNFGIMVPKEEVLKYLKVDNQGITAYDLISASKKLGVFAKGIKGDVSNLKLSNLPCIAHVIKDNSYFHYMVVLEIDRLKKELKLFDPAVGIITMSFDNFKIISTNIFIVFDKENIKKMKDKRFSKYILKLVLKYKKIIIVSFILSIIFIFLSLLSNYYVNFVIEVIKYNKLKYLVFLFLIFLIIFLFKNIISFFRNKLFNIFDLKVDKDVTNNILSHIISLPYEYYSKKTTGQLVTVIGDVENFKDVIVNFFVMGGVDLFLILIIIIYISFYNIIYLPIFLVLILIIFIISYKYQSINNDGFVLLKQNKINFSTKLIESLEAFYTIKGLNMENSVTSLLDQQYSKVLGYNKKYLEKHNNYNFIISNINDIFYLFIIFVAAYLVLFKNFYFLNLVLFSSAFNLLIGFINNIAYSFVMYKIYKSSVIKVLDLLDVKSEELIDYDRSPINKIEFKDICLNFKDKKVLTDINISINKGDKVFICGNTGIGKSSIIKLLLKYYIPTSGKIMIDNINYKYLELKYLRDNITYVSQNEMLFTDSIYNNLFMINKDFTSVSKAIKNTLINETFLKNKIDGNFLLCDNGVNISGGERCKVLIARGLLKANNILVLDESFNGIDIETERRILKNIFKEYKNLTIIFISHRYNNNDLFNKIYDLNSKKEVING